MGVLMMEIDEIMNRLRTSYQQPLVGEKQRIIIFWYDQEQEFNDCIDEIALDNVRIHKLTESNFYNMKYLLQVEDLNSHFLIYCNMRMQDNWLIDALLHSNWFGADKLSLMLDLDIQMLWRYVSERCGFHNQAQSLKVLYMYLTIMALNHSFDVKYLTTVKSFAAYYNKSDDLIFIDRWLQHNADDFDYDQLADLVEEGLNVQHLLSL
jgi:hypothetical protein